MIINAKEIAATNLKLMDMKFGPSWTSVMMTMSYLKLVDRQLKRNAQL
jgi:hypothetical protein